MHFNLKQTTRDGLRFCDVLNTKITDKKIKKNEYTQKPTPVKFI